MGELEGNGEKGEGKVQCQTITMVLRSSHHWDFYFERQTLLILFTKSGS